jgi:uncharacterized protein (DUF1330 family)
MTRPFPALVLAAWLGLSAIATRAAEPPPTEAAPEPPPRPALMLIEADITDMDRFRQYTVAIIPIVQRFGGRYVVMRGAREDLEGDWGATRIVISEWPSMDAARAFWNSPEYRQAVKLREGTGTFRVTLLETAPPPDTPAKAP